MSEKLPLGHVYIEGMGDSFCLLVHGSTGQACGQPHAAHQPTPAPSEEPYRRPGCGCPVPDCQHHRGLLPEPKDKLLEIAERLAALFDSGYPLPDSGRDDLSRMVRAELERVVRESVEVLSLLPLKDCGCDHELLSHWHLEPKPEEKA